MATASRFTSAAVGLAAIGVTSALMPLVAFQRAEQALPQLPSHPYILEMHPQHNKEPLPLLVEAVNRASVDPHCLGLLTQLSGADKDLGGPARVWDLRAGIEMFQAHKLAAGQVPLTAAVAPKLQQHSYLLASAHGFVGVEAAGKVDVAKPGAHNTLLGAVLAALRLLPPDDNGEMLEAIARSRRLPLAAVRQAGDDSPLSSRQAERRGLTDAVLGQLEADSTESMRVAIQTALSHTRMAQQGVNFVSADSYAQALEQQRLYPERVQRLVQEHRVEVVFLEGISKMSAPDDHWQVDDGAKPLQDALRGGRTGAGDGVGRTGTAAAVGGLAVPGRPAGLQQESGVTGRQDLASPTVGVLPKALPGDAQEARRLDGAEGEWLFDGVAARTFTPHTRQNEQLPNMLSDGAKGATQQQQQRQSEAGPAAAAVVKGGAQGVLVVAAAHGARRPPAAGAVAVSAPDTRGAFDQPHLTLYPLVVVAACVYVLAVVAPASEAW